MSLLRTILGWVTPLVILGVGIAIFLTLPLCAVLRPSVNTEPIKI